MAKETSSNGKKGNVSSTRPPVNARIFGSKLAERLPVNGFGNLSMPQENLISVPGITEHWKGEVERRTHEVKHWGGRSIQQRLMGLVQRKKTSSAFQGADLKDNVQLKDPFDAKARLSLAQKIAKKDVVSSDINRNMLLQATVALEQAEELTPEMLTNYHKIQSVYFTRVLNHCMDLRKQFPDLESLDTVDKIRVKNAKRTQGAIQEYQAYIKSESSKALQALKIPTHKSKIDSQKKKNEVLQSYMNAIKVLKFFPLCLPMTHKLSQLVIKFDPNHPIGYFLQARVHKAEAKYLTIQFTNDYNETVVRKRILGHLNQMVQSYKLAMDKISGKYDGLHLELLDEFVSAVTKFYSDVSKIIGAKASPQFLSGTYKVLMAASSSDAAGTTRIEELLKKTQGVMNQWGVPVN